MEEYELRYERAGAVISVNVMELLKAGPARVRKFLKVVKGQEFTTDPEKLESVNEELEKLCKATDNDINAGVSVTAMEKKIYEACQIWLEKPVEHTTKIEVTVKGRFPDGTTEKIVPGYKSESYPGLAYIKNASIIPGAKGWNLTDIESGLRLIEGNSKSDLQYKITSNVWNSYQKIKAGGVATAPADTIETTKTTQVKETKNMITENEKNVKEAEPARIEKPEASEAPTDNKPVASEASTDNKPEASEAPTDNKPEASEAPDGWEAMALLSLGSDKHNTALIMAAGIEAGVFTFDDFKAFYHAGTMPNYHTFDVWKDNGRVVKKGEKAAFSALIWREIEKADKETGEKETKYILKKACFFGEAQTEKAPENKDLETLPADVTSTIENGYIIISGNTKPIKEQLKAAGYRWNGKKTVWYKYARKVA